MKTNDFYDQVIAQTKPFLAKHGYKHINEVAEFRTDDTQPFENIQYSFKKDIPEDLQTHISGVISNVGYSTGITVTSNVDGNWLG